MVRMVRKQAGEVGSGAIEAAAKRGVVHRHQPQEDIEVRPRIVGRRQQAA